MKKEKERRAVFVKGSGTNMPGSCQHSLRAGEEGEQLRRAEVAVSDTQGARM